VRRIACACEVSKPVLMSSFQGRLLTPEASASILSSIMFNWMNPFLSHLRQAPTVYAEDLWALTRHHRAKECHRDFENIEHGVGPFGLLRQIYQSNRHAIWLQCITSLGAVLSHYSFKIPLVDPCRVPTCIVWVCLLAAWSTHCSHLKLCCGADAAM
jgi:hypothetical protein